MQFRWTKFAAMLLAIGLIAGAVAPANAVVCTIGFEPPDAAGGGGNARRAAAHTDQPTDRTRIGGPDIGFRLPDR
jgi:hypothetical protein